MRVVLVTVMGTAVPDQFEQDVLLPYAHEHFASWLDDNKYEPRIIELLEHLHQEEFIAEGSAEALIELVQDNPDIIDTASGDFRKLVHKVWETGYEEEDILGDVYEDAWQAMHEWGEVGVDVYSYGRGLVSERRMIFKHSIFGDLSSLFKGHFDRTIGDLSAADSFIEISKKIKVAPGHCTCIVTSIDTLKAAHEAGMDVILLDRHGGSSLKGIERLVTSFDEIRLPDTALEQAS